MASKEILDYFKDINYAYNDSTKHDTLKRMLTDMVPVVRCKDCKWYEISHLKRDGTDDKRFKQSVCVRGTYAQRRRADWYCADGERREDNG